MEDSFSSTDEEDSKGDFAMVVTPPLFPKPTLEEAEHQYQEMISAMKNHNHQGFSDHLIADSPHGCSCSLFPPCGTFS
jgi:MinD superfamily P-loop ATPase